MTRPSSFCVYDVSRRALENIRNTPKNNSPLCQHSNDDDSMHLNNDRLCSRTTIPTSFLLNRVVHRTKDAKRKPKLHTHILALPPVQNNNSDNKLTNSYAHRLSHRIPNHKLPRILPIGPVNISATACGICLVDNVTLRPIPNKRRRTIKTSIDKGSRRETTSSDVELVENYAGIGTESRMA